MLPSELGLPTSALCSELVRLNNARSVKKGVGISTRRGALSLLLAATMTSSAIAGGPFTFSSTGSLATGRHSPNAILLNNGTVLVTGGVGGSFLASAEVYNPAT